MTFSACAYVLRALMDEDLPTNHGFYSLVRLGLRRDYHFPNDAATFTILSDRDLAGPHGLFGGRSGKKAHYVLKPGARSAGADLEVNHASRPWRQRELSNSRGWRVWPAGRT